MIGSRFTLNRGAPFEPHVVALDHESGQVLHHLSADAAAAVLGPHVDVLEPDPRPAHEGRERREEQGEPHGLAVQLRHNRLCRRALAEQVSLQQLLACDDVIGQALVLRELADQAEDERNVPGLGGTDAWPNARTPSAAAPRPP